LKIFVLRLRVTWFFFFISSIVYAPVIVNTEKNKASKRKLNRRRNQTWQGFATGTCHFFCYLEFQRRIWCYQVSRVWSI
jgi:hypothetical protein